MAAEAGMSEAEWVRRAQTGDPAARTELVRRWAGRALALCRSRLGSADGAEDLAQETLLRALRELPKLEDTAKFGPWLCGIARRLCADWWRSRQRAAVNFSALPEGAVGAADRNAEPPERRLATAEEDEQLQAAIAALPEDCRETLALYYSQKATYQDVARQLGVSAATVNARLTQARLLLRTRLAEAMR